MKKKDMLEKVKYNMLKNYNSEFVKRNPEIINNMVIKYGDLVKIIERDTIDETT